MYGIPGKLPISEEAKISVINPYALSNTRRRIVWILRTTLWFILPIVRLFNLYGTGKSNHLISEIVNQIVAKPFA